MILYRDTGDDMVTFIKSGTKRHGAWSSYIDWLFNTKDEVTTMKGATFARHVPVCPKEYC